jgi:hypothetical protein
MRPGEHRFVLLTVPVSAFLWLIAFVASGAGHGTYVLYALFYAPLALASYGTALVTGPLLHLTYAVCLDRVGNTPARRAWLLGLGAFHYLSVLAIALKPDATYGQAFDAYFWEFWSSHAGWIVGGVAVFVAWQVVLARGVWPRR